MADFSKARQNMVDCQLRTNKVVDEALVARFETVPREWFVEESVQSVAYVDEDVSIGNGRYLVAPMVLARMLQELAISRSEVVLDVGCGTGMFAEAMSQRLKCRIAGIDISAASLEIAGEKGLYERLQRWDLQSTPLPLGDNEFDAAACVGVLTYIENATDLLTDLCRIVRPGGYIVLTQRDDRWVEKDFDTLLASFQARQLWSLPTVSEAMPYLPKNEDFGDSVKVIQVLCQVLRCDRPSAFGGI